MTDLFSGNEPPQTGREVLAGGAVLLRGFALPHDKALIAAIDAVAAISPFRNMQTPRGFTMSVAMTNCGAAGWVSDGRGYRYASRDPETGSPWPAMPEALRGLAESAATQGGYPDFHPDVCLINRYAPGAKLSLHQDKDEREFTHPIVSVSLGLPASFQFGGLRRDDPIRRHALRHGDVVVWGGPSRLFHHGILPLKEGTHPELGRIRLNLTFRRAL
ncbi:DNA oxidative demethylase AlkB [Paracoccus lutimaris]|uniref:Alpha-ketoglutarate-dependent dioxygenase AlkB n=1 Tax=Paracoccus lutimaris TaxID=1490030 RepID=A0A368YI29_9RHOB|nr:DNA oxidative demethylase AlkB [Paracoccus lutimaris]RCW78527.1 DNA-N1-methyladenine dioxygenase [Paracoccus lutimaris]